MLSRLQSAYGGNHSTETAMTKVLLDISLATDTENLSALVLLCLSAATVQSLWLDYCNSLVLEVSDNRIRKVQSVLNIAACLVSRTMAWDHSFIRFQLLLYRAPGIIPVLQLYWLLVNRRVSLRSPAWFVTVQRSTLIAHRKWATVDLLA